MDPSPLLYICIIVFLLFTNWTIDFVAFFEDSMLFSINIDHACRTLVAGLPSKMWTGPRLG